VTLAEALAALYARVPLGMRLGLDAMRVACAKENHPERAFAAVHIGGTNGKGSTCAMVESAARANGKKTGMYTSPHLIRFAERIRINGEPIDDAFLVRVLGQALAHEDLSFFETATLAAFLAFREARVDLAVVEVGIGGRLDATNVLESPRVTAITGVALDHQDKLGDTLALIASEKAAIAKPGVPMVLGHLPPEAHGVALDVTTKAGARIVASLPLPSDVHLGLEGAHQRTNARVAWTIAKELGLDEPKTRAGLATAHWPGRLERIKTESRDGDGDGDCEWLLDGAHNPEGARALVTALTSVRVGAVVFGALEDKQWREMLTILTEVAAPRIYVRPQGRAPASLTAMLECAPGTQATSVPEAMETARRLAGTDSPPRVVVVCGSLYLVGEARALLLQIKPDRIVAL